MGNAPTQFLIPAAVVAFVGWKFIAALLVRRRLPALRAGGAQLVDVRSPAEYARGHFEGSRNIPLDGFGDGIETLDPGRPVVVCCASGTRSAVALRILRQKGFEHVVNAGSWRNLH